jgi:hypothetical protein
MQIISLLFQSNAFMLENIGNIVRLAHTEMGLGVTEYQEV